MTTQVVALAHARRAIKLLHEACSKMMGNSKELDKGDGINGLPNQQTPDTYP